MMLEPLASRGTLRQIQLFIMAAMVALVGIQYYAEIMTSSSFSRGSSSLIDASFYGSTITGAHNSSLPRTTTLSPSMTVDKTAEPTPLSSPLTRKIDTVNGSQNTSIPGSASSNTIATTPSDTTNDLRSGRPKPKFIPWSWDPRWERVVANFTNEEWDMSKNSKTVNSFARVRRKVDIMQKMPIVNQEFKLIFFPIAKVASTIWLKLLRRMAGYDDWREQGGSRWLPYHRITNGLKYLDMFTLEQQRAMLTSPDYVKGIFVRQPHERFLSAYLDKVVPGALDATYVQRHDCCKHLEDSVKCAEEAAVSLEAFLRFTKRPCTYEHCRLRELQQPCRDPHWNPQYEQVLPELWPYINFVGYLPTAQDDAKRLLNRLDNGTGLLWKRFGASGWGKNGTEELFKSKSHSGGEKETKGRSKLSQYFDSVSLWDQVAKVYHRDYEFFYPDDGTRELLFSHPER